MSIYDEYHRQMKKITDVRNAAALLNWDQEVYMPEEGAATRAQQLSTLSGIMHELFTDKKFGDSLKKLASDHSLADGQKRNVLETLREYEKQDKYTTAFVQRMSRTISEAFQSWQKAKRKNDFKIYAPKLEELIGLKKEECEILGYEDHPYDALLDQYEPDAKVADLDVLFNDVKQKLVAFTAEISNAEQVDDSFMKQHYDKDKQWEFTLYLLKEMGYNFNSGRQDLSTHPFTISFGSRDVRVTTRVDEENLSEIIWSTIHEGGHALYEQGLLPENYGLPAGEAISLGNHESQSRLWENNVGRSLNFWESQFPELVKLFPEQLKDVSVSGFHKAMNKVEPSLIRTNADELTYHSHILIRYEIEKDLITGKLGVNDLPSEWNRKYKDYLGIDVPSDTKGVLQDIHWSHGSFGYFPTYSLGSFYAAQFYQKASEDIDELEEKIRKGQLKPLLDWLRENIHKHGKLYKADELCEKVTGEKLNFNYFMDYARKKYSGIYRLNTEKTLS